MTLTTTARNTMLDALTALLNSGTIVFQTAADAAVATLSFSSTAFPAASSGSATSNTITSDTNAAGGTIAKASFRNSSNTEIFSCTVTATGGGGDITAASVVVTAGETVSISAGVTLTQPASA